MGFHAGLAPRHGRHVDVHADATAGGGLAGGTGQARSAEVLDADHEPLVEQGEARLDEALLLEGVAHLDAGPLVAVGLLGEARRGEDTDAPDAIAARGGTQQHRQVADARGLAEHQTVGGEQAQAQHVDERIAPIGGVEDGLATDRGHADGVAVAGHAGDHALGDPATAGIVDGAEPQGIHEGDGPCTHGEDVAEDPPDPGGRPLVGLDRRRVVVRLDADGGGDAVADVDHAGVLARAHEHPRRLGRKPPEVDATALVGTVLRPHHRVHGQLQRVGGPAEDSLDGGGLVVGQPECPVEGFAHGGAR